MMSIADATQTARSNGDPKFQRRGPSSLTGSDKLARALGWFSIGLGITEMVAPGQLARLLGLRGKEGLIRTYGARELASAIPTLSVDKPVGLTARVAGDVLDLATLTAALHRNNPKRSNAAIATALVVGVTLLDIVALVDVQAARRRTQGSNRDYSDRSGLPRGQDASRGLARKDFGRPPDYRTQSTVAAGASGRKIATDESTTAPPT